MWFFKDIILVVGCVAMAVISTIGLIGLGFDIQEIHSNIGSWDITWLGLGFIILVVSFWAVVAKLIIRLNRFEKARPYVDIYPNSTVGRDITLIVHNKGTISAEFSATMTPTFDYIEPNAKGVKIQGLMNIAMVWEASGTANEPINPDGKKLLKLCSVHEQLLVGKAMHYMRFYKVESSKLQSFECGNYTDGDAIPKVRVNIQIDSNMNVKGQRTWVYEIKYINDGTMLTIVPLEELRRKSLIRKVLRLNKF